MTEVVGCWWHTSIIMDDVPKDRYCSFRVTLETASAFYVELAPRDGQRTQFMFWRTAPPPESFSASKSRIRDLRPGDLVEYQGVVRTVLRVSIYR